MPIPQSANRKKKQAMLDGTIPHTCKPDLDNLVKQILDCLTRLRFWHDDKQVIQVTAVKEYGLCPGWEIEIADLSQGHDSHKARPDKALAAIPDKSQEQGCSFAEITP